MGHHSPASSSCARHARLPDRVFLGYKGRKLAIPLTLFQGVFMRVLHTSDWHIGANLCEKSRLDEHRAFFAWLVDLIRTENVDVLLASGDIFDTTTPSNAAMAVYFDFLRSLHDTSCRHVIITGGNHDSPSHLNAPAGYLAHDGIHILGCAQDGDLDREILVLDDANGQPGLIVCAVPFLRDRDVRRAGFGQDPDQRARDLCAGIVTHYTDVLARARKLACGLAHPCPIVGMGHLFARGSSMNDGENGLAVGTLSAVDSSFASGFCYMALGHIHTPQEAGSDRVRYSGSALPMSFGERAGKQVVLLDMAPWSPDMGNDPLQEEWPLELRTVDIPLFRRLIQVEGDAKALERELAELGKTSPGAWVEVNYTGTDPLEGRRERIFAAAQGVDILRIRDMSARPGDSVFAGADKRLDEYSPRDIFGMCLAANNIGEEEGRRLNALFDQVLASLAMSD